MFQCEQYEKGKQTNSNRQTVNRQTVDRQTVSRQTVSRQTVSKQKAEIIGGEKSNRLPPTGQQPHLSER